MGGASVYTYGSLEVVWGIETYQGLKITQVGNGILIFDDISDVALGHASG